MIGVSRTAAAEYTFCMGVPVMLGAGLLKLLKYGLDFAATELAVLLIGMVTAFVVSLLVIRFLLGYIKKHSFQIFGWYRIALGIVVSLYFLLVG
jgi:undecaprenyl-diphosphatase